MKYKKELLNKDVSQLKLEPTKQKKDQEYEDVVPQIDVSDEDETSNTRDKQSNELGVYLLENKGSSFLDHKAMSRQSTNPNHIKAKSQMNNNEMKGNKEGEHSQSNKDVNRSQIQNQKVKNED